MLVKIYLLENNIPLEKITNSQLFARLLAKYSPDNYAFDVRIDGQEFEFQFSIYSNDKNIDVQQKLQKEFEESQKDQD